jgi:hypothetical protein
MVAQTRSSKKYAVSDDGSADNSNNAVRSRRVKIPTPSFREASVRSYKVYTPRITAAAAAAAATAASAERAHIREEPVVDDEREHYDDDDSDVSYIAEAMVELQDKETRKNMVITEHKCLNPMTPITRYAYSIQVYNSEKNVHYRSAYILYDNTTRLYTIYSIISNIFIASPHDSVAADHHSDGHGDAVAATHKLPNPVHTVHTKYTTFVADTVVNYIMTMIVPSNIYGYFIQDDIIGIVASNEELAETAFGPDSSYYDVTQLFQNDTSSRETTNGLKAFHLIPSREFWFDPTSTYMWQTYSESVISSALMIVSQSQ